LVTYANLIHDQLQMDSNQYQVAVCTLHHVAS